ncbi:MAG: phosphotransferase [Oscillospiraceae bacterium]|nr:phosphotransferase [Oscillospiraceae bacterium]
MADEFDTKKEIAFEILKNELNITPMELTRFPNGLCHSVYYVKTETGEFVLRVTESKWHYDGSVKWLNELARLEIPIPQILKNGQYGNVYYTLITYINGKDLGEVYHTLNDSEKRDIVRELVEIQRKVSTLPSDMIDGSDNYSPATCMENVKCKIKMSRESIAENKVFDPNLCDAVAGLAKTFTDYFANVKPTAYLNDIQTNNVLIHDGKLEGIVDIDEIGYGDPFRIVGLTNSILLFMNEDTKYIDYWLDEIKANTIQRKVVTFYTLLYCIGLMGERGSKFGNDTVVPVNQDEVKLLNSIYNKLLTMLQEIERENNIKIDILKVPFEKKHILRNMLELYFYDMSEFDDEYDKMELNDAGLYGYGYLDYYWNEEGRYPYLLTVDQNLAGLALIRVVEPIPLTFEVAEFFIMKKYRKLGIGSILSSKIFELHKGKWTISTPIKNIVAQNFWRKAVKNAAPEKYEEYLTDDGRYIGWLFDNINR